MAKNFDLKNTSVVFANPERSKYGLKNNGSLEYWSAGEKGDDKFPSPDPNKNVLEVYDDKLKNNPEALKQAIYGDLMHGMANDKHWNQLRTEFMSNFTPEERKRQQNRSTWWDDVNGPKEKFGSPTYDAYIRGVIANDGDWKAGQKDSGNTMYSPKQLQILQKMKDYIKTGKEDQGQK